MLKAIALCVIVYSSGTNGDYTEKRNHEMAHCHGWKHGERNSFTGKAYSIPKRFVGLPDYPNLKELKVSTKEAKRLCGGPMACQWFEKN